VLLSAYGIDKLRSIRNYQSLLEHLFSSDSTLSLAGLEDCVRTGLKHRSQEPPLLLSTPTPKVKSRSNQILELLTDWVAEVLKVFLEPSDLTLTYPGLYPLHRQYGLLTHSHHDNNNHTHSGGRPSRFHAVAELVPATANSLLRPHRPSPPCRQCQQHRHEPEP